MVLSDLQEGFGFTAKSLSERLRPFDLVLALCGFEGEFSASPSIRQGKNSVGDMNIACMHQSDLRTERKSPGNRHADPSAGMKRRGSLLDGPVFEAGWLNVQADSG